MPKDDVLFVIDSQSSTRNSAGAFVISAGGSGGGGISNTELANYLRRDGSSAMTGNLDMGNFSIVNVALVDGIDIPAHVGNPDAHHNRQHQFDSIDHQGLLPWDKIDFAGSDLYDVANRPHVALTGIGPNDHHNQVHAITGGDHTAVGALALDVIGIPSTNGVLGYITPSSNPGASIKLLRTDAAGLLVLKRLEGTDYLKSTGGYLQAATYVSAGSYVSAVTYVDTPIVQQAGNVSIIAGINIALKPTGYVYLDTDRAIRTNSFVSGFAGGGWQIDQNISAPGTNAEFDNLTIRGRMRVYELIIQQIRATNGSIFVSSVSKIKSVTQISGDTYEFVSEDYHGFFVNDLIRAQRFTNAGTSGAVYRCDMRVTSIDSLTPLYKFRAVRENGSDLPFVGMDFVRIGNTTDVTRQGSLYLSSDDSNAPFIDVVNGVDSWTAWTQTAKTKVRIGKITGITSTGNEYGLIAGNTGFGDNDAWIRVSNLGIQMNNIPLKFFSYKNSVSSWTGYWSADGNELWLGRNVNDKFFVWHNDVNTGNVSLTVRGTIFVTGGDAATTTAVNNAQTNAINYTNGYAANMALNNTTANWALGASRGGNAVDVVYVNGVQATVVREYANRAGTGLSTNGRVVLSVQSPSLSADKVIGLNLTSEYLGYYNGTAWTNFIKSDGTFRFGSAVTGNRIEWNGTQLAGYNTLGDLQWYASSADGLIYAGGGYVIIGNQGVQAGTYTLLNSNGVVISSQQLNSQLSNATISLNRSVTFLNDLGTQASLFGGGWGIVSPTNYRAGMAYMQAFRYSFGNVLLNTFTLKIDTWAGDVYFALDTTHYKMWHAGNHGPGSGLNADLIDGVHLSTLVRNDISQTFFGNQIISGTLEVTNYIQADRPIYFIRQSNIPAAVSNIVQMYQGGDGNMYFRGPNGYARITGLTVLSGSFP